MINALNNTRTVLTASAAVAAIIGLSACGSNEQATTDEIPAPVATETAVDAEPVNAEPVTDQPAAETTWTDASSNNATPADANTPAEPNTDSATNTVVTTVADQPATDQFIPASSPDLPCTTYVEVTEYPVFACSTGSLVEDFQNLVAYANPDFEADGFFGTATYDAVITYQETFGMEPTGVLDQQLMDWMETSMLHSEPIDDEPVAPTSDDTDQNTDLDDGFGTDEGEIHHEAMSVYCAELADGQHPDANITLEVIEICEDLDIRLTSGD